MEPRAELQVRYEIRELRAENHAVHERRTTIPFLDATHRSFAITRIEGSDQHVVAHCNKIAAD